MCIDMKDRGVFSTLNLIASFLVVTVTWRHLMTTGTTRCNRESTCKVAPQVFPIRVLCAVSLGKWGVYAFVGRCASMNDTLLTGI